MKRIGNRELTALLAVGGLMAVAVNGGSAAVSLKLHTGLSVGLRSVR